MARCEGRVIYLPVNSGLHWRIFNVLKASKSTVENLVEVNHYLVLQQDHAKVPALCSIDRLEQIYCVNHAIGNGESILKTAG